MRPPPHLFTNPHSFRLQRERQKVRRPRRSVKPDLEELTPRIVPSASGGESQTAALPMVAAMEQQEIQLIEAVQNEIIGIVKMVAQQIAQEEASLQRQWGNLFSEIFNPQNPSPKYSTPSAGSGSGSVAATMAHTSPPTEGTIKPMAGGGGGGTTGSTATVSGQVWLDNNADGNEDDGESGYSGVTVELETSAGGVVASTTTNASGNYSFTVSGQSSTPQYYQIQVIFPQLFFATTEDSESEINSGGYSAVFALTAGATQNIPAGIDSMKVTTSQDDANGAIPMQITLRDAMDAGNKGKGPQVTFASNVSGTISLQAALPAIEKSYNIVGTGGTTNITVNGNSKAGAIFTVNAGVTSAINNLTITGGSGGNGGGILNNGNLTLAGATVTKNQTTGSGAGIYNGAGAKLTLNNGDTISSNTAQLSGGGLQNAGGTVLITSSALSGNTAKGGGGGIKNAAGGKITASNNVTIADNSDALSGGGVLNAGTFIMRGGSINYNSDKLVGGGVANTKGTMTLSGVGIQDNRALLGGGIYVSGGSLTLKNGVSIGGKFLYECNVAAQNGGGMFVNGGTVKMTGGVIGGNSASGNGGGVLVAKGSLKLTGGAVVSSNTAQMGAGVYKSGGTATISGGSIKGNTAKGDGGGGIFLVTGSLTLKNKVVVSKNSVTGAGGDGGGIAMNNGTMKISGGSIANNSASQSGGGIYVNKGKLSLTGGVKNSGNTAQTGAGMFMGGGAANISSGTIGNNTASKLGGGGIFLSAGSLSLMSNVWINNNDATGGGNGAGVYVNGGTMTMAGGTILDNRASNGGGIYINMGTLTLRLGVNIIDNTAASQGGGAYLAKDSHTRFNSCTVSSNVAAMGAGVYWQNGADVIIAPNGGLIDDDDPGGVPFKGP
jgi:hypothetical protein